MKHSELPWLLDEINAMIQLDESRGYMYIADCETNGLSYDEEKANAQFIVKACNSHYKLLELLKAAACPNCDGSGTVLETTTGCEAGCCGNFLPTGECCGNPVPVPVQIQEPAPCQFCYEKEQAIKEAE